EWHAFRNGRKSPNEIHDDSDLLAFWTCSNGHAFRMRVSARTAASESLGCPRCCRDNKVDLATIAEAAVRFELSDLNSGFDRRALPESYPVFWRCPQSGHLSYESLAQLRQREWQCSICSSEESKRCLADYPALVEQLVRLDGKIQDPSKIPAGSHKEATWKCDLGPDHTWIAPVYKRTIHSSECPFCANKQVSLTNSLANFPEIIKELHPAKNGTLPANAVIAFSRRVYWWQCSVCRYEWQREVYLRTQRGSRCPRCKGKPARANRLNAESARAQATRKGGGRD
ncbi:MAG: zinc-ribbon domain-containing protein, partial [Terriglobales bacterium]